jgi:hypothetical protein
LKEEFEEVKELGRVCRIIEIESGVTWPAELDRPGLKGLCRTAA